MGSELSRIVPAEIDNVRFYDPALFPRLRPVIDNCETILEELKEVLGVMTINPAEENGAEISGIWCEDDKFDAFYQRTKAQEGWMHWWNTESVQKPSAQWTVFGLIQKGLKMDANCKLCPKTTEILSQIPDIRVAGFSRIQPHSGIDDHCGFTGRSYGALVFHLGLIIPPGGTATLTCDRMEHAWQQPGEVIIFDDTFVHSAHNGSGEDRIVLYIDFALRPEDEDLLPSLPPAAP